jgi:hypothetical protein
MSPPVTREGRPVGWHAAFEASEARLQRLLPPPATDNAAPSNLEIDRGNRWQRAWRWMPLADLA